LGFDRSSGGLFYRLSICPREYTRYSNGRRGNIRILRNGSVAMAIAPTITITMDVTMAVMGRFIKTSAIISNRFVE
jgi:hypothetical protein